MRCGVFDGARGTPFSLSSLRAPRDVGGARTFEPFPLPMTTTTTPKRTRREPSKNLAWLRRDTRDPRRRAWTPRRIDLLRALHAEPWLTFGELGERLGIGAQAAWSLVQRCVRDGLAVEHRTDIGGRPSRRAVYRITDAARRVVERKATA